MRYKIVLENNTDFVLVETDTLEKAKKQLDDMLKTDLYLSEYYNWDKLPKYKIIESEDVENGI